MESNPNSEQYDLLDLLAEEFADRFRRGEHPSLREYTDRHPELAAEIRELFPAMAQVERIEDFRNGVLAEAPPPARPALSQVGDYRILREIGRGGLGEGCEAERRLARGRLSPLGRSRRWDDRAARPGANRAFPTDPA